MRLIHSLFTLSVIAAGAALSGGCVENRATLFIHHVIAQDPEGNECDVSPTGERFSARGVFDPLGDRAFVEWVAVGNQLVPLGDNETLRPETSRIQIEGAEISIPGTGIEPFIRSLSGTIDPDDSTNPGFISVGVELIPAGLDIDDGEYVVDLIIYGRTLGGTEIESGTFSYPVLVDNGSHAACGFAFSDFEDAEIAIDPCGRSGMNGYAYACPTSSGRRGCQLCQ